VVGARTTLNPQIIGHRGAAGLAPENTLVAIRTALALGVDGIEIDVHLSLDRVPVVIHDASTLRTCGVNKQVAASTWEELRYLDAGGLAGPAFRGEQIPSLDDVLALLDERHTLLLEIKAGPPDDWAEILRPRLDVISCPRIILMGFDAVLMSTLKAVLPNATVLHLLSEHEALPEAHSAWDGFGVSRLLPIPQDRIAALKSAGKIFSVWTVNDPCELPRWPDADFITTDRPDLFVTPKER